MILISQLIIDFLLIQRVLMIVKQQLNEKKNLYQELKHHGSLTHDLHYAVLN